MKIDYIETKEKVTEKILDFISYKSRTQKEVTLKLSYYVTHLKAVERKDKERLKQELFFWLQELDLIDDNKYAQEYVKEKINSQHGSSKPKIRQFLLKKGVAGEIIEKALGKFTFEIEKEKALSAGQKKMKSLSYLSKSDAKLKLYRYLVSRGYAFETVRAVVDTLLDVK